MRDSRHSVSLRTFGLAFAVVLSPALMQMGGRGDGGPDFSCTPSGDTRLSELAIIVDGQDQIAFDSGQQDYDGIWLPGSADSALVSAIPVDLEATVTVRVYNDSGITQTMVAVSGGGEAVTPLEPGLNKIEVVVMPIGGASGYYRIHMGVGCSDCSDGNECTTDMCDPGLEVCEHSPLPIRTPCDFGGGIPGACVMPQGVMICDSACTAIHCDEDYNDCTNDMCEALSGGCEPVADGTPCAGGTCLSGACEVIDTVLPCTEQALRNALAAGGGPYTFDCLGPTTLMMGAETQIDNDIILDGGGLVTVDGGFGVPSWATVQLHGFTITGGQSGIWSYGTLTVANCTISGNEHAGIRGGGTATLIDSIVSGNGAAGISMNGATTVTNSTVSGNATEGISAGGMMTVINSTVSGNTGSGIFNAGALTLTNSTVSGNTSYGIYGAAGSVTVTSSTIRDSGLDAVYIRADPVPTGIDVTTTLINGACAALGDPTRTSNGYNIESPGNTCGFDQVTDQVDVTAAELNIGPLQDNGGPTETHALGPSSVAIDVIPEVDCVDPEGAPLTADQRGVMRPQGIACDVGAFELEVAP